MKIGVLGGTFDPVHLGHVAMAESARDALGLAEVLMVPAGQPVTRINREVTAAGHRLKMLRLAVKGRRGLVVSELEIERPGPTYTVDTLAELRERYVEGTGIYFILGCDSLAQISDWREPDRLVRMCRLVAVPRPGCPRPDMAEFERRIPGISAKVIFLERPCIDISATMIKETIARGRSIERLVPGPVAEYIKANRLYQKKGDKS